MDEQIQRWILAAIDERISEEDFERLQQLMEQRLDVREAYLRALSLTQTLTEMSGEESAVEMEPTVERKQGAQSKISVSRLRRVSTDSWVHLAVAATLLPRRMPKVRAKRVMFSSLVNRPISGNPRNRC